MSPWRIALGALLVAGLGIGAAVMWARGGNEAPPVQAPTPAPSPTEDPAPDNSPPETPDLTGDDFTAIVSDIVYFLDRLSENPDPSRVGEVFHRRCECFKSRLDALQELRRRGWRYEGAQTEVLSVERERGVGQRNRALLDVVLREGATVVVDSKGEVVETIKADPPTRFTMILVRESRQDAWRVSSLIRQGPAEGEG